MAKPLTQHQRALLRYFADGREAAIPYNLKQEQRWASRACFIERTRSAGIANTRGGASWGYRITQAGRLSLAGAEESRPC